MGLKSMAQATVVGVALVGGLTYFAMKGRGGQCNDFAKATEKVALDTAYANNLGASSVVATYAERRGVFDALDVGDEQLASFERRYVSLLEQHKDAAQAFIDGKEDYATTRMSQLSKSSEELVAEINAYCGAQ